MQHNIQNLNAEQINTLACKLGEIQRHIIEDTNLLDGFSELNINLNQEIDGYECLISALNELQSYVNKNI